MKTSFFTISPLIFLLLYYTAFCSKGTVELPYFSPLSRFMPFLIFLPKNQYLCSESKITRLWRKSPNFSRIFHKNCYVNRLRGRFTRFSPLKGPDAPPNSAPRPVVVAASLLWGQKNAARQRRTTLVNLLVKWLVKFSRTSAPA